MEILMESLAILGKLPQALEVLIYIILLFNIYLLI